MKKILLVLSFIIAFTSIRCQVVFCPPGAAWHYNFGYYNTLMNEEIKYIKDSIVGLDTLKILSHARYYLVCNPVPATRFTHIKQIGDTVFFRNAITQNTWQILYNFACQPGESWQTTYLRYANNSTSLTLQTKTFIVNSVSTATVNNKPLKRMTVGTTTITERIGSNTFLFPLDNSTYCHIDNFAWMLCYQDSTFGLQSFKDFPCDFAGTLSPPVGLEKYDQAGAKIYPNPANDFITIETAIPEESELSFTDSYGREVKRIQISSYEKVDISDLSKGIYLLLIAKNKEIVYKTRLIKD